MTLERGLEHYLYGPISYYNKCKPEIVAYLLERSDRDRVLAATWPENREIVQMLLGAGFRPNRQCLDRLANRGRIDLMRMVQVDMSANARLLATNCYSVEDAKWCRENNRSINWRCVPTEVKRYLGKGMTDEELIRMKDPDAWYIYFHRQTRYQWLLLRRVGKVGDGLIDRVFELPDVLFQQVVLCL